MVPGAEQVQEIDGQVHELLFVPDLELEIADEPLHREEMRFVELEEAVPDTREHRYGPEGPEVIQEPGSDRFVHQVLLHVGTVRAGLMAY